MKKQKRKPIKFVSRREEEIFRRCLRDIPSDARIERFLGKIVFLVRPKDLLQFGRALNAGGLQNSERTNYILRHLDRQKDEYICFEHLI